MNGSSSDPRAVVFTDGDHEERPDCLVVIVPPGSGAWEWDDDWASDEFWLRSVARLVARAAGAGSDPVGAVVCGSLVAPLLPGNIDGPDAMGRAVRLLDRGAQRRYAVVVNKETGKPLLCKTARCDAAADIAPLAVARAELCKRVRREPRA